MLTLTGENLSCFVSRSNGRIVSHCAHVRTVVVVPSQILLIDKEVVVFVQLPELAVDDVEMLITEIIGDLVDVFLLFQQANRGQ